MGALYVRGLILLVNSAARYSCSHALGFTLARLSTSLNASGHMRPLPPDGVTISTKLSMWNNTPNARRMNVTAKY